MVKVVLDDTGARSGDESPRSARSAGIADDALKAPASLCVQAVPVAFHKARAMADEAKQSNIAANRRGMIEAEGCPMLTSRAHMVPKPNAVPF
eukprot:5631555-Pleurochrysis_carterae.AAC.5